MEYAKPTPKLRDSARAQLSRQRSEQASPEDPLRSDDKPKPVDPEVSLSSVDGSGASCDPIAPEEPQAKSVGLDPASTKVSQPSVNSPEPAVPKVTRPLSSGPEPESDSLDLTPQTVSGSQEKERKTIPAPTASEGAQTLGLEPISPIPRVSSPVVGSPEPASLDLGKSKSATARASQGPECARVADGFQPEGQTSAQPVVVRPEPASPKVPQTLGF